jgi:hypothetical protein
MHKRITVFILVLAITAFACGLPGNLIPTGLGSGGAGTTVSGSNGLKATVSSPVTVKLTWTAVAGVKSYLVELKVGDTDFIQLAQLTGDQVSFLNFPAPHGSPLTYRVTAVTDAGNGEGRTVSLTTQAVKPNPLTVKPQEYPAQPWAPPTAAPNATLDPSQYLPPGYDINNPDSFDPSSLMGAPPTASELIGPQGGSVSVITTDKITYKLDVPAGAVEDDIRITLTPIQSIDGLPFNAGQLGAVRIDPQGFHLAAPATLTISLPKAAPVSSGTTDVAFAFNREGTEFHLVPILAVSQTSASSTGRVLPMASTSSGAGNVVAIAFKPAAKSSAGAQDDPPAIKAIANVVDLATQGIAPATPVEVQDVVENHPPSDPADQSAQAVAAAQAEEEMAPLAHIEEQLAPPPPNPQMVSIAQGILNSAVAAGSWSEFMEALTTFQIYLENGGKAPGLTDINNKIWDEITINAKALFETNKLQCLSKDEFNAQELAERLTNPKDNFSATFAIKFTQKFGDQSLQDVAKMVKKCKLSLQITSTISYQIEGLTTSASVKAKIPLKWKYDRTAGQASLYGTGALVYTLFDMKAPGCSNFKFNTLSGSTFTVNRLQPVFSNGQISDFTLVSYVVTGKQSSLSGCGGWGKSSNGQTGDIWGGLYTLSHMPDDWLIRDWDMLFLRNSDANKAAERTISVSKTPFGGQGNITENTTFTIVKSSP